MGGRGGSSGKKSGSGGASGNSNSSKKISGSGAGGSSSGSISSQPFTPSRTPVSKMSDSMLQSELTKAAGSYYASGKSGISFGGRDPYQAAAALTNTKMSRAKMEREYKSILRKLK